MGGKQGKAGFSAHPLEQEVCLRVGTAAIVVGVEEKEVTEGLLQLGKNK